MAEQGIDRGGLIYRIQIEAAWREEVGAFRAAIQGARADLEAFRQARTRTATRTRAAARQEGSYDRAAVAEVRRSQAQRLEALRQGASGQAAVEAKRVQQAANARIQEDKENRQSLRQLRSAILERAKLLSSAPPTVQAATLKDAVPGGPGTTDPAALAALRAEQAERLQILQETNAAQKALEAQRVQQAANARQREDQEAQTQSQRLKGTIQERYRQIQALEAQMAAARQRTALGEQKADQQAEAARTAALRQAIQERYQDLARLEGQIAQTRQRTALAEQRAEAARNQARIQALRQDIQERSRLAEQDRLRTAKEQALQQRLQERARKLAAASIIQPEQSKNLQESLKGFLGLNEALGKTESTANRLGFTFRRLFGIMAAFTIARNVAAGFASVVKEMVTLNGQMESARLGIASLYLAAGTVRDAMGNAVSATQRLPMAQAEARRQTELLRQDALKTSATFQELAETYQTALAPGLNAGMSLNQIREFTVRISQAASALAMPQNQLAEEIRSILTGNIQSRTTRIAVSLNITPEDIRRAKEEGKLVEFLQQKFSAFALAGQEAMGTFEVILGNVREAFDEIIRQGGLDFFTSVKALLKDISGLLTSQDPLSGAITPDPRAVALIQALGDGLAEAVAEAAARIAEEAGLRTAALSGGCFQNRLLLAATRRGLQARGLEVLVHRAVPANDGGVALGQAAIAAIAEGETEV